MRYINQQDALKALGDCIKPGTKKPRNDPTKTHAPTQEQTPRKRAAYNINERFIITSYFHAVLGGGFEP